MECNDPTITEAIDICVAAGAEEIIAVPYFLHTGTHVADDLPTLLEEAHARYPHIHVPYGTLSRPFAPADRYSGGPLAVRL